MNKLNRWFVETLHNPLTRLSGYLFFYFLLIVVVNALIISTASFFHFLLKHKFPLIEEWVFRNGWEIITCSKLLAAMILSRFLNMYTFENSPLRDYFSRTYRPPHVNVFVGILFLGVFILALGGHIGRDGSGESVFFPAWSFLGVTAYYLVDLVILLYLMKLFPIDDFRPRFLIYIFACMLSVLCFKIVIPFWEGSLILIFLNSFVLIWLFELTTSWTSSLLFLLLLISPLGALWGIDPIWGNRFSIFLLKRELNYYYVACLYLVVLVYWYMSIRNRAEKLKRDQLLNNIS